MQLNTSKKNPKILNFLTKYLIPFKFQILIVLLSVAVVASSILGLGHALKYLIDQGFKENNLEKLNQAFIILLFMVIILSGASYLRSFKINWICEQLETAIKKDSYKNIIRLSPAYFDLHKVNDIVSRLTNDLTLISTSIIMIFSFSLRNLIMAVGGLIILLFNNFQLTSYVLLTLPLILIPLILIGRKTRALSKETQQEISNYNSHIEESLTFIKIVQAYNREDFENEKLSAMLNKASLISKKRIQLRSLLFALVIALILIAVSLVLLVGGHDVIEGKMTAGSLSSFIFYSIIVATSIGGFSEVFSDWQRALGALERVIEINELQSEVIEVENPLGISNPKNIKIAIDNLSFSYPEQKEISVLNDINISFPEGKTIAIVGPSGAGKSSIFQLLLRFYDPISGSIRINDTDIKNFKIQELRSLFALVPQETTIFSGTAYENILYGNVDASEKEVENAAKLAEILDFFKSLPDGLNTYLGEKGIKLSGGQKQRIAIARAILRNPKILLLDEATSSLDNENERLVQVALDRLKENRSTIIIAHRISTIKNADLIIVLEKGKILSQGTHKQLLETCPLYQKLNQEYLIT